MKIENKYDEAIVKSKKYLESMSALDLMLDASEFHKKLIILVDSLHIPSSITIGILTAEVYRLCNEPDELKYLSAFELFKKHIDENFIRKE